MSYQPAKENMHSVADYSQEAQNALGVSWLSAVVLHHPSSSGCKQVGTFHKAGVLCESAYICSMAVGKPVKNCWVLSITFSSFRKLLPNGMRTAL